MSRYLRYTSAYVRDDQHVGDCRDFGRAGWSFATVCDKWIDERTYGRFQPVYATIGPDRALPHFADPYVEINGARLATDAAIQDVVIHELGHLLGLGHSSNPGSIMCVPACGGPPPGSGRFYDHDDATALIFLYHSHAVAQDPSEPWVP